MKHVLSVGQCGIDHRSIVRFLQGNFDVDVTAVATTAEASRHLRQGRYELVLVNRQFDADGTEGLDFIKQLKDDPELDSIPVMLITNFSEYADQATALGALPGFGKAEFHSSELVARLGSYLPALS